MKNKLVSSIVNLVIILITFGIMAVSIFEDAAGFVNIDGPFLLFAIAFCAIFLFALISIVVNIVKIVKKAKEIQEDVPGYHPTPKNGRQDCPADMNRFRTGLVDDDVQQMRAQGADIASETVACPKCGFINKKTDKRCALCGSPIKKD